MPLVLEYPDKYRLWSDLIQGNNDRVFIRTTETPPIGGLVPVMLALPGLPLQITIDPKASNHPLGHWDSAAQGWSIADGAYSVHVGNSSRNVALSDAVTVRTPAGRAR